MKLILNLVKRFGAWIGTVLSHLADNRGEWDRTKVGSLPSGSSRRPIVTVTHTFGKRSREELLSTMSAYIAEQVLTAEKHCATMQASDQMLCPAPMLKEDTE